MPPLDERKPLDPAELRSAAPGPTAENGPAHGPDETFAKLIAWGVPFGLVVYLAMRGGGYDAVIRTQVGIGLWLLLGTGAVAGVIWHPRLNRRAVTLFGVFAAFAAWTAASLLWTDSEERTMAEVVRVVTYLGAFALLLSLPGRDRARSMIGGLASAIAVISCVALLSRLHPSWFGPNILAESQPLSRARLAYPLDAWNGLATFISLGLPLLVVIATEARHVAVKALAAAALPILGLTTYLTYSRGGTLAAGVALLVLFAIYPRRWEAFVVTVVALAGAAVLIIATDRLDALANGLDNATAHDQGTQILVLTTIVASVVAGIRWLIDRRWGGLLPSPRPSRRTLTAALGVVAVVALAAAIAVDVPNKLSNSWEEFKQPSIGSEGGAGRLASASGNGRYQYWDAAVNAGETAPMIGIGAGGYEYWWARHATIPGLVRDAHSLYFETFGELGLVGLALLGGFIIGVIATGARRSRTVAPARAGPFAAATAGATAFAIALAFDWGWEIAVVPVAVLVMAAAILAPDELPDRRDTAPASWRLLATGCSVVALLALTTSYIGVTELRASHNAFNAGDTAAAIDDAKTAQDFQPYAASPLLQHALLLEQQEDVAAAIPYARAAASKEPTNWRIWLTLSRLEVANGDAAQSLISYEYARRLNPLSTLIPTADPRETHPDQF